MSHYTGYYGKIIVREEFFDIIENGLDLTASTDPVFLLYEYLDDENRFDHGFSHIVWSNWSFDRESGCWEFRVEYNESHQGCPHVNLINFFIPYISKEIIDIYYFDEDHSHSFHPYIMHRELISALQEEIERREETIKMICEELNTYRR